MQIYQVGGAVRDRLLGIEVYDHDWVVVGADAEQMLALGYQPVGKDFPVFLHPDSHEEYALARTERKSGQGYGGFTFHAAPEVTLEQDLMRRDLTVNAIAEDDQGNLYDPYQGQQDLQRRLLRHVSPAFAEDPLRVLRVARFLARFTHLGFSIASETLTLMARLSASGELQALSAERVWKETERALTEADPEQYFITLERCGALDQLMPELSAIHNIDQQHETGQPPLQALTHACAISTDAAVRWAVVCHGIEAEPALEQLHQRLKIPNHYRHGAQLLWRHQSLLQTPLSADSVMALHRGLDLQRRPERLQPFIDGCSALSGIPTDQPMPIANQLQRLMAQIDSIKPKDLVDEGFKGAALGQELQRRRQGVVQQALNDTAT